jgi:hypothetical protein
MTIISTHRVHTYKAASVRHRDISPKKVPTQPTNSAKKTNTPKTINTMIALLLNASVEKNIQMRPDPSAPPAVMMNTTITVWGCDYEVNIPQGFDIYEGLRLWYPNLYKEVICEDAANRAEYTNDDDDTEEAWAEYEYREWLCDF